MSSQRRILLTGASGVLGRNFLEGVGKNADFNILALLRPESRILNPYPSVKEIRIDFSNTRAINELVSRFRPEVVVHCAASGMELPRTHSCNLIRFNVDFTIDLCESAAKAGTDHFIFIGTGLAYRPLRRSLQEDDAMDTMHPYGASKAAADLLVRSAAVEFNLPLTVLRPFSFTGLGDDRCRLFPSLLRAARNGEEFKLTSGFQIRDHISARDIAQGIFCALERPPNRTNPAIYNLGSGSKLSIKNLVEKIVEELGLKVCLHFGAKSIAPFEPEELVADSSRAQRDLKWRPTHRLAHAVWQLARESFPQLDLQEPKENIE